MGGGARVSWRKRGGSVACCVAAAVEPSSRRRRRRRVRRQRHSAAERSGAGAAGTASSSRQSAPIRSPPARGLPACPPPFFRTRLSPASALSRCACRAVPASPPVSAAAGPQPYVSPPRHASLCVTRHASRVRRCNPCGRLMPPPIAHFTSPRSCRPASQPARRRPPPAPAPVPGKQKLCV